MLKDSRHNPDDDGVIAVIGHIEDDLMLNPRRTTARREGEQDQKPD